MKFGRGEAQKSDEKVNILKKVLIIPCYNEEMTIAKVVEDFRAELPDCRIIVMDNRSTDDSAKRAVAAGAEVIPVARQGKGAVMRAVFRSIDADICIMVDGDDTYPADEVHKLLKPVLDGKADMAAGDRLTGGEYQRVNRRRFHGLGNQLVKKLVNFCFKSDLRDIMTGYRVFNRTFAMNVPILSDGFEIETEMTIRALDRRLALVEIPVAYRDRPVGSFSKLNTLRDGFRVLKTIFFILKDYRPMLFFGTLSLFFFMVGCLCGAPVIWEFMRTRFITHVPLALLATGLVLVSVVTLNCALILDTVVAHERQRNELELMNRRIKG
jgi:glycosyltransferase involved in cell wall biosynthesis